MTDTNGTPGGTPAGNAPGNTDAQGFAQQRPAMPAQGPAQPEQNPRARGHSPAADQRSQQQQPPPAEQKIKVGDAEYSEADVHAAIAERAEAASRKATLPSSPEGYEIKLPADFQAPEGVRFEFDAKDPALKRARELAHQHGISSDVFQQMLGVYASTKMGEAIQQSQLRDTNMRQLGSAGPQRVEAVATWLTARAGADGKTMSDFLRKFPSAPIVKTMENLMRVFSNQGGADFSQSHRETQANSEGKIPGYENMSFAQKRAAQMQQMMQRPGYRGGGSRTDDR
jgi:hypothetical protein